MSDLPEYLERADIDGTFAINILQLPLRVRTTPTPLQLKWSARTKCDEPPRGIPGLDPSGRDRLLYIWWGSENSRPQDVSTPQSQKPKPKLLRALPLKNGPNSAKMHLKHSRDLSRHGKGDIELD